MNTLTEKTKTEYFRELKSFKKFRSFKLLIKKDFYHEIDISRQFARPLRLFSQSPLFGLFLLTYLFVCFSWCLRYLLLA